MVLYVQQVQRLLQITTPPLVVITGRQSVLHNRPSLAPQPPPGCGAFYCAMFAWHSVIAVHELPAMIANAATIVILETCLW